MEYITDDFTIQTQCLVLLCIHYSTLGTIDVVCKLSQRNENPQKDLLNQNGGIRL